MQRRDCKIQWINPSPSHDRRLIVSWSLSQPKLTCHPSLDITRTVGEHVVLDTHQDGFSCPLSSLSNTAFFFHSLITASLSIFHLLSCFPSLGVKLFYPICPFLWLTIQESPSRSLSLVIESSAATWLLLGSHTVAESSLWFLFFLSVSLRHLPALSPSPPIQEKVAASLCLLM